MSDIRTEPRPTCPFCEVPGAPIHRGMIDRIGGAPGEWSLSRCPSCGHAWLDPMPRPEDLGKAYERYFMHQAPAIAAREGLRARVKRGAAAWVAGYDAGVGWLDRLLGLPVVAVPGMREQALASVMHLQAAPGRGRLLDVGCATGAYLEHMRDLGWDVAGVEMDAEAARIGREQRGIDVRAGALEAQGFPAASFDAVTLSHVIEHVPDPVATLRECRRILRPGGRIVLTTPNVDSRGHRRFGSAWIHLDPPRHLHLFGQASLRLACERAGIRVHQLRTSIRWADGVHRLSGQIERTGKGDFSTRSGAAGRLAGLAYQHMEWIEAFRDPWNGEELVLIAG